LFVRAKDLFNAAIGLKELRRALNRLITPRPAFHRASKLRDRSADDDTDINRCGGWSREQIERMDSRFVEAMRRAGVFNSASRNRTNVVAPPTRSPVRKAHSGHRSVGTREQRLGR
jgi:hypothetical protein